MEWKKIEDIGDVVMCKRIMKHETSQSGEIPFFKIGTLGRTPDAYISRETYMKYKVKYNAPKAGDVLISCSGTIGRTVVNEYEEAYFQDSNIMWVKHDGSQLLNRFLYYYYNVIKWNVTDTGTIQRLYKNNIETAYVPVPPLPVQQLIIDTLDKFSTLTEDLVEGLPRELELHRKQYEHYRKELLTFSKKSK